MSLRGLCVFACSLFALTGALGQSTTASMLGVVHDPSGAAIPNAEVTATNMQTTLSRTTQTDGAGSYLITNLPVGPYQLHVVAPGFETYGQNGITLDGNPNPHVDATLK